MVTVFGPYGAPAQNVFKNRSVILVCGGIGVTPFASILQFFNSNREHDAESFDHTNPKHSHTPGRSRAMSVLENTTMNHFAALQQSARTEEVQFIWVCSDLSSLSWFTTILKGEKVLYGPSVTLNCNDAHPSDINLNQRSQVCAIRIQVYITSLPSERLDTVAFHLAKRMFFEACGYDAFSSLSELCYCGRPDWFEVLTEATKRNDVKRKGGSGTRVWRVLKLLAFACVRRTCALTIFILIFRYWRVLLWATVDGKRSRNQHGQSEQQREVQVEIKSHGRKVLTSSMTCSATRAA